MSDKVFVDTNIWYYAFVQGEEEQEAAKSRRAVECIRSGERLVLSTQVLNELSAILIRKANFGESSIRELIDTLWSRYEVMVVDRETLIAASRLREAHLFSYWDSLILSSAIAAGCSVLQTEDLQHGRIVESHLRIVNPLI